MNGNNNISNENDKIIKSLEFSEIRSTKRTHPKDSEGSKLLESSGIVDPASGNIITVAEAIKLHLLDVRTGEIVLISGEKMSLEKAAEHKLIDVDLASKLSDHLDAVRRELAEAENNDSSEKRVKVTTSTATIRTPSNIKTIADAIKDGTVDAIRSIYKLSDGTTISITDAYQRGLLIKNESVKIKSTPLCLADAIAHGLVDQSGWVIDRNGGDKFRLDSAIANDLILSNCQEIVDTRNDVKVTVADAVASGLLNTKTGRYINPVTKEKLTFIEAKNRQLISRPATLKDICDLNLLDRDGLIYSPTRKRQLTILEAISCGILDGDKIHSISLGCEDGNLITLNEAIGRGIVGLTNNFTNFTTNEVMTIQSAVDEGFISSVSQKSIFEIDGFKDIYSNEYVSLNEALAKGLCVKARDNFKIDTGKNQLISLEQGINMGIVRAEVNEMLSRRVGVFLDDKELSVLDLVLYDLIDPKSGYLLENSQIVPLNLAIERKIITPEGALLLSSLLNITLTTETVTRMEKRYITIANTQIADYPSDSTNDGSIQLADAIEQNIFDPQSGIFTIPNTDRLVSFEECIQLGLINSESLRIVDPKYKEEINVHRALERNILDSTGHYHSTDGWIPMNQSIEKGIIVLEKPNDTKIVEISESPSLSKEDLTSPEPLEVSPGMFYDPSTALVIDMKTGKSSDILQAVKNNLIDAKTVKLIDHSTGEFITIDDAVKKDMISMQSGEIKDASGKRMSLIDAVKMGLLIVAGAPVVAAAGAINSLKMVFDPTTNQHIPVELAYERGLVSRDEISDFTQSESMPRSAVMSQFSSFDIPTPKDMAQTPSKSRKHSVSNHDDDEHLHPIPIPRKSFDNGSDKLSTQVTVNEALQRGLLDLKNDCYTDPQTNEIVSISAAIAKGLLVSSTATNVEDEICNISPIHAVALRRKKSADTQSDAIKPIPAKRKSIESAFTANQEVENVETAIEKSLSTNDNDDKVANETKEAKNKSNEKILSKSSAEENSTNENLITEILQKDDDNIHTRHSDEFEMKAASKNVDDGILNTATKENENETDKMSSSALHKESLSEIKDTLSSIERASLSDDKHTSSAISHEEKLVKDCKETSVEKDDCENAATKLLDRILHDNTAKEQKNYVKNETSSIKADDEIKSRENLLKSEQEKLKDSQIKQFDENLLENQIKSDEKLATNEVVKTKDDVALKSAQDQDGKTLNEKSQSDNNTALKSSDEKLKDDVEILSKPSESDNLFASKLQDDESALNKIKSEDKIPENDDKLDTKLSEHNDDIDEKSALNKPEDIDEKKLLENQIENVKLSDKQAEVNDEKSITKVPENLAPKTSENNENQADLNQEIIENKENPSEENEKLIKKQISQVESEILVAQDPTKVENKSELSQPDNEITADEIDFQKSPTNNDNLIKNSESQILNEYQENQQSISKEITTENQLKDLSQDNQQISDNKLTENLPKTDKLSTIDSKSTINEQNFPIIESKSSPNNTQSSPSSSSSLPTNLIKSDKALPPSSDDKQSISPDTTEISKPDDYKHSHEKSTIAQNELKSDSHLGKDIANAAKMGLMAIVGAPILAGMAVADSVKNMTRKSSGGDNRMAFSTIQELSESVYSDKGSDVSKKPLEINENLSPENLESAGAFDKRTNTFVDPVTSEKVSFDEFIFNCGVFDPELIYVKDHSSDMYVPLAVALEKVLIDRNTGMMVEPKTGKRIPFFECLKRKWIIQREPEKITSMSMEEARNAGLLDDESGKIAVDGILLPVSEALNSGVLEIDNISIRNSTGEIIPLVKAIQDGTVDLKRGTFIDPSSGECKLLDSVFKGGDLLEGIKTPISLQAAIDNDEIYDKNSKTFKHPLTLKSAVDCGLIDPIISEIKNTLSGETLPLKQAESLFENDLFRDTKNNQLLSLDDAVQQNLITTKPIKMTLIDVIAKEYYKVDTNKILNPMNGQLVTLEAAIKSNFIDITTTLIVDDRNECVLAASNAISCGLIDTEAARLTYPDLNLRNAYERGYILSTKKPISLADAIIRNLYNPLTGKLKAAGDESEHETSLDECIKSNEISTNDLIIHDPKTNNIISVADAIKCGLIDAKHGCVNEPFNGAQLTFNEAVDRGIIILSKRKCSLPEAVFKGLYDPTSGTFANTLTTEKLSTERAIKRGFIDPQSTVVNVGGKILPFELSVETGMVDTKRGTITDEYGNKIDFREAFDRGILVEVRKPIGLYEALVKNIYDERSGLFMDPKSGSKLTLEQAISEKLIDPNSVKLKDTSKNIYHDLSLLDAIHRGVIDDESHVKIDSRNLTLRQAFDLGILCDSKAPISIQRAIHQGTYDGQSGKISDAVSGKKMTLHEAMRRYVINPQLPCYFDECEENLMSLSECCRMKMIDRREGVFKEPGSNVFMPLNDALNLGLIVDIESGGFSLYEMLAMKLYDTNQRMFINPINGRNVTMTDALQDDLISPLSSYVKDIERDSYVKLTDAIKKSIIDTQNGVFVYPNNQNDENSGAGTSSKSINLQEARKLGFIVSNQKLLSLESAINMGLYRVNESGQFVDPANNERHNLQACIDIGLIDSDSTIVKNILSGQEMSLKCAIEMGDVDVKRGCVIEPDSKVSSTFDVAFNKGLLVTIRKPLTGRSESSVNVLKSGELSSNPTAATTPAASDLISNEMSLAEAIQANAIQPEKMFIKHPKTGQFITLAKALSEKDLIDVAALSRKIAIDASATCLSFDANCLIYWREPESFESAVESGHLNLSNGAYINPDYEINCNLKEAITAGCVDPDSALIKDGAKGKLIRLPEAFRKGLIDSDKFNVVDTSTSKLLPLRCAVDDGIIITPKRALDLLDALKFNLYECESGQFKDPFIPSTATTTSTPHTLISLNDAIAKGLIDISTTMVRDLDNKEIAPLSSAIASGLIDSVNGRLVNDNEKLDFVRAREKGLLLPAEQRVSTHKFGWNAFLTLFFVVAYLLTLIATHTHIYTYKNIYFTFIHFIFIHPYTHINYSYIM